MFRSDEQKIKAFRVLLQRIDKPHLWTDNGPAPELVRIADTGRSAMSGGEKTLCLVTMALWGGNKRLAFALVDGLDNGALFAVGSLLCAVALGSSYVDAWIDEQQAIQRRETDAIRAFMANREEKIRVISDPLR